MDCSSRTNSMSSSEPSPSPPGGLVHIMCPTGTDPGEPAFDPDPDLARCPSGPSAGPGRVIAPGSGKAMSLPTTPPGDPGCSAEPAPPAKRAGRRALGAAAKFFTTACRREISVSVRSSWDSRSKVKSVSAIWRSLVSFSRACDVRITSIMTWASGNSSGGKIPGTICSHSSTLDAGACWVASTIECGSVTLAAAVGWPEGLPAVRPPVASIMFCAAWSDAELDILVRVPAPVNGFVASPLPGRPPARAAATAEAESTPHSSGMTASAFPGSLGMWGGEEERLPAPAPAPLVLLPPTPGVGGNEDGLDSSPEPRIPNVGTDAVSPSAWRLVMLSVSSRILARRFAA
mmetsp:Transcript_22994/g.53720  ORF Transcript_22994/g.53720 Transcript_22994/m.53720 type:complete len:346 (-) Transcript_22994:4291-5328(-)